MRKKSNGNLIAAEPKQGWAFFEETGQWRRTPQPWGAPRDHFPKELGDWVAVSKPKSWQPPTDALGGSLAGESLLGAGGASLRMFAPAGGDAPAGGGHTKIGAGHKPQGYDEHGRYTGPRGGSIPMDGGPVRLYANEADETPDDEASDEEPSGEDRGDEQETEAAQEAAQELEGGILVADNGRVASDAGGGLSGGTEVRGPVTPPQKQPAEVTWKNDNGSPVPTHEKLEQQTRETVENLRKDNPQLDSFNVNSGKRDGTGPHAEGRAVDIN